MVSDMTIYTPAPSRALWRQFTLGDALFAVGFGAMLFAGCWW
jgi:hypothetical protein